MVTIKQAIVMGIKTFIYLVGIAIILTVVTMMSESLVAAGIL